VNREGVFSQQYSEHPTDVGGSISWQDSEQIAKDSCAHSNRACGVVAKQLVSVQ
jgi:hypothetical protein